jgi:PAS domain S-box-containing protein
VYLSTIEGRFVEVDPLLAEMLGYAGPQNLIDHVADIGAQLYVRPESRQQLLEQLLRQGSVCNFESQLYRKDGEVLWVSEFARALRDEQGHITHLRGGIADISLYKRLGIPQLAPSLSVGTQPAASSGALLQHRRLPVKDGTRIRFIESLKISYVRADGDYVHVHMVGGERTMARDRISNLEQRLGSPAFVRISKSLLVNAGHIKELRPDRRGGFEVSLDSGEQLSSGPAYRENLDRLLAELG